MLVRSTLEAPPERDRGDIRRHHEKRLIAKLVSWRALAFAPRIELDCHLSTHDSVVVAPLQTVSSTVVKHSLVFVVCSLRSAEDRADTPLHLLLGRDLSWSGSYTALQVAGRRCSRLLRYRRFRQFDSNPEWSPRPRLSAATWVLSRCTEARRLSVQES